MELEINNIKLRWDLPLERETIICPFCGAPYTDEVPHDAVQVKCKYCRGIILLPSYLSKVPRCPNHPGTIAMGFCNDCNQSFCKECLHMYRLEHGKIYICPNCLRSRQTEGVWVLVAIILGMLMLSLLGFGISLQMGIILILVFCMPFVAYALYRWRKPLKPPTIQEIEQEKRTRAEQGMISSDAESLYMSLFHKYVKNFGVTGPMILDKKIYDYMKRGLLLEDAIKKLAKVEERIN